MTPHRTAGRRGNVFRRARQQVLATNPVCWICGHTAADVVDHQPPRWWLMKMGLDPNDPTYMRPAHGVKGCPTCGRRCNNESPRQAQQHRERHSRRW